MGAFVLAATGAAVWQAFDIYTFFGWHFGMYPGISPLPELMYSTGHFDVGVRSHIRRLVYVDTDYDSPYIHTNGQWIARSILSGFFTAPIEALPEITVTDVVSLSGSILSDEADSSVLHP